MGRERPEGSWGHSGVQCWPMGCFKALEGSRAALQPLRQGAPVAWEPLYGGLLGGEPQILFRGSIPAPTLCCFWSLPCMSWTLGMLRASSAASAHISSAPRHLCKAGSDSSSPCTGAELSCSPPVPTVQLGFTGEGPPHWVAASHCNDAWGETRLGMCVGWWCLRVACFGRRASPCRVSALSRAVVSNPCLCSHGACCPFAMQTPMKVKSRSPRVSLASPSRVPLLCPCVSPLTCSHLPCPHPASVCLCPAAAVCPAASHRGCSVHAAEQGRVPVLGRIRVLHRHRPQGSLGSGGKG